MLWAGRVVSALPVLMLLMSGVMKLVKSEDVEKGFRDLGWDQSLRSLSRSSRSVALSSIVIPRTAVLGAILLTGYLGGATATHVRIGEPFYTPIILGVLVWGGLYLRDARLRALLPLRKS